MILRYLIPFLLPVPALAHAGPHLHPHGAEGILLFGLLALAVSGWAVALWRGRK